jgi:hypothetical protein
MWRILNKYTYWVWGLHTGDYEDCCLSCNIVQFRENYMFHGTCHFHLQCQTVSHARNWVKLTIFLCSVLWLLVTDNVPSKPILVTLMMEAIRSTETSVLTRATLHNIPEDGRLILTFNLQYDYPFQNIATRSAPLECTADVLPFVI